MLAGCVVLVCVCAACVCGVRVLAGVSERLQRESETRSPPDPPGPPGPPLRPSQALPEMRTRRWRCRCTKESRQRRTRRRPRHGPARVRCSCRFLPRLCTFQIGQASCGGASSGPERPGRQSPGSRPRWPVWRGGGRFDRPPRGAGSGPGRRWWGRGRPLAGRAPGRKRGGTS